MFNEKPLILNKIKTKSQFFNQNFSNKNNSNINLSIKKKDNHFLTDNNINNNNKKKIQLSNDFLSTKIKQYEKSPKKIKKKNLPKIKKYSNKLNKNEISKLKYMNDKILDDIFSFNEKEYENNNFNGFYTNTDYNVNKNKSFSMFKEYNLIKNRNKKDNHSYSTNYYDKKDSINEKISKFNEYNSNIIKNENSNKILTKNSIKKRNTKNSITFNSTNLSNSNNNNLLATNINNIKIKRFSTLAILALKLENDLEDIDEYDYKVKVRDNFFKLKKLMQKQKNKNMKLLNDVKHDQILNENMLKIFVVQLKNKHNFDYQKYKLQI